MYTKFARQVGGNNLGAIVLGAQVAALAYYNEVPSEVLPSLVGARYVSDMLKADKAADAVVRRKSNALLRGRLLYEEIRVEGRRVMRPFWVLNPCA